MVLATRCPQCATAFRVAPDQIRLRGGWVRCGVCNEVFDSSPNLIELESAGGAPRPVGAAPPDTPAEPFVLRRRGEGLVASSPDEDGTAREQEPAASADFPPPLAPVGEAVAGDLPSVLRPRRAPFAGEDSKPDERGSSPQADPVAEPEPRPGNDGPPPPIMAEPRPPRGGAVPAFIDDESRRRRRRAQWWWGMAALLALLVLLAEAAWVFRAEIATRVPALRPAMEHLCQRWQCTVGYPRAPELLVVESSAIEPWTPESPGFAPPIADEAEPGLEASAGIDLPVRRLALRMVLRNRASFPQSWPAIELSLMDLSDTVAARRVLLPSVYLSPREFAKPLGPLEERVLRIPIETIDARATGYRVAIFYP